MNRLGLMRIEDWIYFIDGFESEFYPFISFIHLQLKMFFLGFNPSSHLWKHVSQALIGSITPNSPTVFVISNLNTHPKYILFFFEILNFFANISNRPTLFFTVFRRIYSTVHVSVSQVANGTYLCFCTYFLNVVIFLCISS